MKLSKLENILQHYPRPYLTDIELGSLFGGTPNSRYAKVKRLLASKELLHVRRGLYSLTDKIGGIMKPHPYELAQYIYGPSYISLESALSYHQLIPEAVYTVTSVSTKRTKEFQTPLGIFSYMSLSCDNFYTDVSLIQEGPYSFLMANPWKAICDYVHCYKKDWKGLQPLLDSLRIEENALPPLESTARQLLEEYYQSNRIHLFLKGIL